jgi:hypothetical protein
MLLIRSIVGALLLVLAGCGMQPAGFPRAHLQVSPGAVGRDQVSRISQRLERFSPVLLLDEKRGVANIALRQRARLNVVSKAAKEVGARLSPGLDAPSAAFLRQAACSALRPCNVARDTECEFTAEITPDRFRQYFDAFARRLTYGGYGTLAVLYKRHDTGNVVLHVPMYEHCALGSEQLTEAWRYVSSGQDVIFKKTSDAMTN